MKNVIKRIIREVIDNLEWVKEIQPDLSNPKVWLSNEMISCRLEKIESGNWKGWTLYFDPNDKVLFMGNIETEEKVPTLYVDYDKIYKKLDEMGLDYDEKNQLCKEVLWGIHGRKVNLVLSI